MDQGRFARIEELFHRAAALDGADRDVLLDAECAGDAQLRQEVESLLAGVDQGEVQQAIHEAAREMAAGQRAGRMAGPYRLVRPIGEGGMGTVWLGERDDEAFEKQVAVKFALGRVDTQAFADRLKIERHILASLDHPNIARLLDGGNAADNTPYVVMEYVDGQPIIDYCREQRLGVRERLELFLKLCGAVQYAHQNLVVHRDIKPSNVLVRNDGEPKLLDFGIAKLLETGEAAPTATAARLMTPGYASPEQISGAPATTSTDVYSLGVLLYEMLAGNHPFQQGTTSPMEILRRVCETEPPEPSAAARPVDARLAGQLAGDLDSIVLKALRKEPGERFLTVEQFAQDVRRFLGGYPVESQRGVWSYRTRKFIQRNRAVTALAAALAVSLLGFGVGMALLARQAARERDAAEEVSRYLISVFEAPTPSVARGNAVTAREVLDRGAERVNGALGDKPELQARMLVTLGRSYFGLGLNDRAKDLAARALGLYADRLKRGTAEHADALYLAGVAAMGSDRMAAKAALSESLEIRRRIYPPAHRLISLCLLGLGTQARDAGDYETAERLLRQAAEQLERTAGLHDSDTLLALNGLGTVLRLRGRRVESTEVRRRAAEASQALFGPEHPSTASSLSNLGTDLAADGNYAEAERLLRQVVALNRKLFGNAHVGYGRSLGNLGVVLALASKNAEAEPVFREALEAARRAGTVGNVETGRITHNLSRVLLANGDYAGAERMCREAIAINAAKLGPNHPEVAQYTDSLAIMIRRQNRFAEGAAMHRKALTIRRAALRPGHPGIAVSLVGLGAALAEAGKAREAEPYLREALSIREAAMAPGQWEIAEARSSLGSVLLMQRKYAEAEPMLAQALKELEEKRGAESREAALARERLERLRREWRPASSGPRGDAGVP